jgi:anti-anti-sigma regulatory factor
MPVATIGVVFEIDEELVVQTLQEAGEKLDGADGELVLDFSSVRRIDPGALREIERLADLADEKAVKVVLRGVNIDIYKVLKLVKLAPRFSFLTGICDRTESCHATPSKQ